MCTNCDQPMPCDNPCTSCGGCVCTCSSLYDTVGCINITSSDCVQYLGTQDISCLGIKRNDTLTTALKAIGTYTTGLLGKVNSNSLSLTLSGSCMDSLAIEMVPSTNIGNILTYGTDGRPYVPKTDVSLISTTCFSWQKTINGQVITYVPIIDWNCVSQQVCPLCDNPAPCVAPTGLIVTSTGQTTATVGWNSVAGVTYDVLVNGVVQSTSVTSPYTFNSLVPSTTYSLTVRAKCSSGSTADTTISVTTLGVSTCVLPSNIAVVMSGTTASITWTPGGGGGTQVVDYKLNGAGSYTTFGTYPATTSTVSISGLSQNVLYNFRITNNCSGGSASASSSNGASIACPTMTNVTTDTTVVATITIPTGDIDTTVVNLYDSTGTTILQTQTFTAPFTSQLVVTFTSLTPSTTYLIGTVQSIGSIVNNGCTKSSATTTAIPGCALPTNLTVTIN